MRRQKSRSDRDRRKRAELPGRGVGHGAGGAAMSAYTVEIASCPRVPARPAGRRCSTRCKRSLRRRGERARWKHLVLQVQAATREEAAARRVRCATGCSPIGDRGLRMQRVAVVVFRLQLRRGHARRGRAAGSDAYYVCMRQRPEAARRVICRRLQLRRLSRSGHRALFAGAARRDAMPGRRCRLGICNGSRFCASGALAGALMRNAGSSFVAAVQVRVEATDTPCTRS